MINCIILDDEPLAVIIVEEFLNKIPYLNLLKTFTNSKEASEYLKTNPVDLVFLDIEMPQISGLDFCKKYCQNKIVIFTTAYSNYALLGYELNILDYLLKPIELNRFLIACEKARQKYDFINLIKNNKEPTLILKSGYQLIRIIIKDIIYVEAYDDYVKVFTEKNEPVLTKLTMNAILKQLENYGFVRVHRSFIISKNRIKSYNKKYIKISKINIPIGKNYRDNFLLSNSF